MSTRKPTIKVVPGQIWADKYPGSKGRTVRIIEVGPTHATVEVATEAANQWSEPGSTIGRQTRVMYDHRGLRGYRLESEPEHAPADEQPYNFDTATAREVVEHWRATAVAERDGKDRTVWLTVEMFAIQVLRAMDREAKGEF